MKRETCRRLGASHGLFYPSSPSFLTAGWDDGDFIDVWHGLRAVHLPGHLSFYCERLRLMFTADLFASGRGIAISPPVIFNSTPAQLPQSVAGDDAYLKGIGVIP